MPPAPRLSILIPNFNNGRLSSRDGSIDFIGDLLQSLADTLRHDPTPVEILVLDDGSTDDSLATCRAWAAKTWSDVGGWRGDAEAHRGEPFLRLIERPHSGVLSINANLLTREARGEFCARLDGDIVIHTMSWARRLCAAFDSGPPDLGVIGPKQLTPEGWVHAAGDWILHPRGYHHIAAGAHRDAVTRAMEVDHVMGCFYCHRRRVWEEVGGYDETFLRGQTIDFGLMARLRGWRAFFTPDIEFTHRHVLRKARNTTADTTGGIDKSLLRFEEKWGFSRLAPDLDVVAAKYKGTPLLWNAKVFGPRVDLPVKANAGGGSGLTVEQTEWKRFASDAGYQEAVKSRLALLGAARAAARPPARERPTVVHLYGRAGLLCHLLAKEGVSAIGIDPDPQHVALARRITARETYPAARPVFHVQTGPCALPLADGSADIVLLPNVLEYHHNPVGLLKEVHRVLAPGSAGGVGGVVAILALKRTVPFDLEGDSTSCFRPHELAQLLKQSRLFDLYSMEGYQPPAGMTHAVAVRKATQSGASPVDPAPPAPPAASAPPAPPAEPKPLAVEVVSIA
ncbi:MAG: methyltransferase domain-containing protein [Phycisphaeraceae bacterium]|nr:MAG: methyltransferase domain-containing protein [Phycisphaeraceae bacterium]